MAVELTEDQLAFLEECNLEFSERFTDADLEYKKVYDAGIPPPPIVYPWWGHTRGRNFNRDRPGSSRYNDNYRDRSNDHREENRRPGSFSPFGESDGVSRYEGRKRYSDSYRDRSKDHHQRDNDDGHSRQQRFRPY